MEYWSDSSRSIVVAYFCRINDDIAILRILEVRKRAGGELDAFSSLFYQPIQLWVTYKFVYQSVISVLNYVQAYQESEEFYKSMTDDPAKISWIQSDFTMMLKPATPIARFLFLTISSAPSGKGGQGWCYSSQSVLWKTERRCRLSSRLQMAEIKPLNGLRLNLQFQLLHLWVKTYLSHASLILNMLIADIW